MSFILKRIIIVLVIIISASLTACVNTDTSPKEIVDNRPSGYGNTPSNIGNGGRFAQDENYIYYSLNSANGITGLCKMDIKGKKTTLIEDMECGSINVLGDWIYYVNKNDDGKIYKIDTDGNNNQKLSDIQYVTELTAINDKLYFLKGVWSPYIYVMDTNGNSLTQLTDSKIIMKMCIQDDVIYFVTRDADNQYCIYKINLDGTGQMPLRNLRKKKSFYIQYLLFDNDYLFYSSTSEILRMDINSSDEEIVVEDLNIMTGKINIYGNTIYYSALGIPPNFLSPMGIHALNLDTGEDRIITSKIFNEAHIVNNKIYFLENINNEEIYYVMNLDGSDLKTFW